MNGPSGLGGQSHRIWARCSGVILLTLIVLAAVLCCLRASVMVVPCLCVVLSCLVCSFLPFLPAS
ncbi:hypothetical protein FN846DRAFT_952892 [Sphaerosporella brunnea]|uniref:Uncharacterized protein n=1 Tax=Sphaerosporella brunnea TaxID=1250544 RepID=A0A5J5EUC2_9PEZI|nr:hypothetical protein FN846DRAFT_952892 [Sphaerosporella brunnea]